jgi:hypothetical protein
MKFEEAEEKSLTVKWEIGTCSQGERCWCRTIKPIEPILFDDGDSQDEYWIVGSGELHKNIAEYFVELHNKNIENKIK